MIRSSTADMMAGTFALLVVTLFYTHIGTLRGLGRDYPMGLLTFIFLGGLYLLGKGIYRRLSGRDPLPDAPLSCGSEGAGEVETVSYGRVAFILVVSLVYVYLMTQVGFYIASMIFLFGTGMALSDVQASGGWKKLALASAIFTAVMCICVYIVFVKFLYVPTPVGELIWMLRELR